MDILETIMSAQGGGAINQIASQFGLRPEQAQAAVTALLPSLAAGLQTEMQTESGLSGLTAALSRGQHDVYLDDPAALTQPATVQEGNGILGHIFGSKEVSRQVAAQAAQKTGIDQSILKKILPIVAALAMGGLSKRTKMGGGAIAAGGLMSMLGPLLDRNKDGSMMDDVAGMLGGALKGRRPS
jgi:hypothetical protein